MVGIAWLESLEGAELGITEASTMLQAISQSGAGMFEAESIHANIYATQPVAKFVEMLPRLIKGD